MKYIACFVKWAKSRLAIDVLFGLIILAIIALGFNQAARSLSYNLYASHDSDCTALAVSLSFDYLAYPLRPNKNSSDKNHDRSSYNSTAVTYISGTHSPHLSTTGFTHAISSHFRQFNHTCLLLDMPPPIFS